MIGQLITNAVCGTAEDDAVLDKYVAGLPLTKKDRFILAIVFAGEKIASFLSEDDQEKAMDIHDCLAECILESQMFGQPISLAKAEREDQVQEADSKRSSQLFRVRKTHISVTRPSTLQNDSNVSKQLSSSQLTRPGTGESSTTLKLKPLPIMTSLPKCPQKFEITNPQPSLFSIPFNAKQDLSKKLGNERCLVLASLSKRFTTAIQQRLGQPILTSLATKSCLEMASKIAESFTVVREDIKTSTFDQILKETLQLGLAEGAVLNNLVREVVGVNLNQVMASALKYENLNNEINAAEDFNSLKLPVKRVNDAFLDKTDLTIIDMVHAMLVFDKTITVAKSAKFLHLALLVKKKEQGKKICLWLCKSVTLWGKALSQFTEELCKPEMLYASISNETTSRIAAMKHLAAYLKAAASLEEMPTSAIPGMDYFLLSNKQAWSMVADRK